LLWGKSDHDGTPLTAIIPNEDSVTFITKIKVFIEQNLDKQTKMKHFVQGGLAGSLMNKLSGLSIKSKIHTSNNTNEVKTDIPEDMTVNLLDIANKENLFTVHPKLHS